MVRAGVAARLTPSRPFALLMDRPVPQPLSSRAPLPEPNRRENRTRIAATTAIYAAFAAVALVGCAITGRSVWHLEQTLGGSRLVSVPVALALGAAVGMGSVSMTQWISRAFRWGRALEGELKHGLIGLEASAIPWLAFSSALGEELLFRGAIQAGLVAHGGAAQGVVLATALFGALHVPWNRRLIPWTVMATAMGLVFGLLFLWTGELLAPLVAHALVNYANLRYLLRRGPSLAQHASTDRDPLAER